MRVAKSSKRDLIEIKIEMIIEKFLEKNKEYTIEIYITNAINDKIMSILYIPIERNIRSDKDTLTLTWKTKNVECNHFSLIYDEIMDCYEELVEPSFQAVSVLLKNGMKFQFECVGIRV